MNVWLSLGVLVAPIISITLSLVFVCLKKRVLSICFISLSILLFWLFNMGPMIGIQTAFRHTTISVHWYVSNISWLIVYSIIGLGAIVSPVLSLIFVCARKRKLSIWFTAASLLFYLLISLINWNTWLHILLFIRR